MSFSVETQLVGAFSTEEGKGNPVYVVYDMGRWTSKDRQQFTTFANVSECVFVRKIVSPNETVFPTAQVQIFNPNGIMKFAGHPLIGTIRSLYDKLGMETGVIDTGEITVSFWIRQTSKGKVSELEVPNPQAEIYDRSLDICNLYDLPAKNLSLYNCGPRHVLLQVPDSRSLSDFDPRWEQLKKFDDIALNVYCVNESYVENRMFSPAYGVYEDRATGSVVIPLLKEMRINNPSLENIRVIQGTNRDSGVLMQGRYLPLQERYILSGNTNSVLKGEILS